jgi:hypothetical protein
VFASAFCQKALTCLTGARILESMRRDTNHNECRPTELLHVQALDSVGLRMNHTERATALDAILTRRNDLAAFADECHVGMIAPVFAGVPLLIWQDYLIHVALNPAGQGLCRRYLTDSHYVCVVTSPP